MHEARLPLELEAVFRKRGSNWTSKDTREILAWIEEHCSRDLRVHALRYLCGYSTPEDTWHDFILERWEGVVRNYDPARQDGSSVEGSGRFLRYLRPSLRRFCSDVVKRCQIEGETICPDRSQKVDTEEGDPSGFDFLVEIRASRAVEVDEEEELARLRACVGKALQRLARSHSLYHELVVLFYFREMSQMEIAATLNMTEINVRVKLHRARQTLKKYLSQEGFGL